MSTSFLSRRALMRMSGGLLLAAGVWPGALAAEGVGGAGDFSFISVNDLHYWDAGCVPFFNRVVARMKEAAPRADLMLIGGDQVEHGKAEEFDGIRQLLKTMGLPMKAVIGNHDWASMTDNKAYQEAWPNSLNYCFEHHGWQIVCLDTTQGTNGGSPTIGKPTFDWVAENLPKLDKQRPMILLTHFPLAAGVTNRARNADALLEPFKAFNLRWVINAHYHAKTERTVGEILLTTAPCCSFRSNNHDGSKAKGFYVCRAADGKIEREFVEVPAA